MQPLALRQYKFYLGCRAKYFRHSMTVLLKDRYTVKVPAKDCIIFIYTDDFALATQNKTLFM